MSLLDHTRVYGVYEMTQDKIHSLARKINHVING